MADVFISYSRADSEFARRLADEMSARGRDAWRDVDDIHPAEEFWPTIQRAIEEAHGVIFILTPDFLRSDYCRREFDHAALHQKRAIPVLRRQIEPGLVPLPLARLNWIAARDSDGFSDAVDDIVLALDTDLAWVRTHTRLVVRSVEWDTAKREKSYLLHGVDLTAADQALALAGPGTSPEPTTLQREYVLASRRGAATRQRRVLSAVVLGLLIAAALGLLAEFQRRRAVEARQRGLARQLAAQSELVRRPYGEPLTVSLLLAAESLVHYWSIEGDQAMRRALTLFPRPALATAAFENQSPALSPDGRRVALLEHEQLRFYDVTSQETSKPVAAPGVAWLAWSRDGERLLGIDQENLLRLWNTSDGSEQQLFTVKSSVHDAIAFSENGQMVAVAEEADDLAPAASGPVHVWNGATRTHSTFTPAYPTVALWVSDDAAQVLTMGSRKFDSRIQSWQPPFKKPAGEERLDGRIELPRLDAKGSELAFVNRLLHVGGGSTGTNEVLLDSLGDYSETRRLPHPGRVTGVTPNRADTHLATNCSDNVIRVWSRRAGAVVAQVAAGREVRAVALSDDAKRLAFVDVEGVLHVYADSGETHVTSFHVGDVSSVAFQPDGERITTLGDRGRLAVFEAEAGADLRTMRLASEISSPRFTPDGDRVIAGGMDALTIFPVSRNAPGVPLPGSRGIWVFAPDGKTFFTLGSHGIQSDGVNTTQIGDDDLRRWDIASGRELQRSPMKSQSARTLSPDGRFIATSIGERELSVSTLADGREVVRLGISQLTAALGAAGNPAGGKPLSRMTELAFSQDGTRLAVLWDWRVVQVWTLTDRTAARPIVCGGECDVLAFDPGGRLLVIRPRENLHRRQLWDVRSSAEVKLLAPSSGRQKTSEPVEISEVAFSKSGRLMATASGGDSLRLWNTAERRLLREIAYQSDVWALAFTSDGAYLATGSTDNTARVWDVRSGQELSRIARDKTVYDAAFSPDDRVLVTSTLSHEAHLWLWWRDDLLADAGRRLSRNLTPEEWRAYLPDEPYRLTFEHLPDPRMAK